MNIKRIIFSVFLGLSIFTAIFSGYLFFYAVYRMANDILIQKEGLALLFFPIAFLTYVGPLLVLLIISILGTVFLFKKLKTVQK